MVAMQQNELLLNPHNRFTFTIPDTIPKAMSYYYRISANLRAQLQTPPDNLSQVTKICTRWLESSNTRCELILETSTTVFDTPNTTTSRWVQTATSTNWSQLEHTVETQVNILWYYGRRLKRTRQSWFEDVFERPPPQLEKTFMPKLAQRSPKRFY